MLAVRKAQAMFRSFREPTGDADSSVPSAPVNATLTWLVNGSGAGAPRSDAVWELVADGREKPRPQAPGPRPQGS